jgi:hypothetical protein
MLTNSVFNTAKSMILGVRMIEDDEDEIVFNKTLAQADS